MSDIRDIVLWGASRVGKTTALASYFCHRSPAWLDNNAEESQKTLRDLRQFWNLLQRNQLPAPNVTPMSYEARSRKGTLLRFRDMRGGDAEMGLNEEDLRALREASGVLLFLSWPGDGRNDGVIATRNALGLLGRHDRPVALVLTKVESYLRFDELARFRVQDALEIARDLRVSQPFQELLREMPPASIFPITVYGYSTDGHPAHYLDEFSQLVPWNIRPQLVELPFNHLLEGLTT